MKDYWLKNDLFKEMEERGLSTTELENMLNDNNEVAEVEVSIETENRTRVEANTETESNAVNRRQPLRDITNVPRYTITDNLQMSEIPKDAFKDPDYCEKLWYFFFPFGKTFESVEAFCSSVYNLGEILGVQFTKWGGRQRKNRALKCNKYVLYILFFNTILI